MLITPGSQRVKIKVKTDRQMKQHDQNLKKSKRINELRPIRKCSSFIAAHNN